MKIIRYLASLILCAYGVNAIWAADAVVPQPKYPYKTDIVTTCFWVGDGPSGYNAMDNVKSAWDPRWVESFGGVDAPVQRTASVGKPGSVSLPTTFVPRQNPYYVALPFNDLKFPDIARKLIPWWNDSAYKSNPNKSQCQGRWIKIYYQGHICYAQWQDVGPYRVDHYGYVFGNERPMIASQAGLDVSPAVRDYLGLNGLNKTTWRFVDSNEVPLGPWIDTRFSGPVTGEAPRPLERRLPRIRLTIGSTGSPFSMMP